MSTCARTCKKPDTKHVTRKLQGSQKTSFPWPRPSCCNTANMKITTKVTNSYLCKPETASLYKGEQPQTEKRSLGSAGQEKIYYSCSQSEIRHCRSTAPFLLLKIMLIFQNRMWFKEERKMEEVLMRFLSLRLCTLSY